MNIFQIRFHQNSSWDFPKASPNPQATAIRRLQKDFQILLDDPIPGIIAMPTDRSILEWHYVIEGTKETCYEGGYYHGKIVFKPDFPWQPPAICMVTPNGRFMPNVRLCLSISDYHPESWNPGWTVSAILVGLHSFMNEESFSTGCVRDNSQQRRRYAQLSIEYNLNNPEFVDMFPELADKLKNRDLSSFTLRPDIVKKAKTLGQNPSSSSRKREHTSQATSSEHPKDPVVNKKPNPEKKTEKSDIKTVEVIDLTDD